MTTAEDLDISGRGKFPQLTFLETSDRPAAISASTERLTASSFTENRGNRCGGINFRDVVNIVGQVGRVKLVRRVRQGHGIAAFDWLQLMRFAGAEI